MNLFWKRIAKTANFEQEMANRHSLYHTFVKTEKSELLKEYKELADIDFKQAQKQFDSISEYKENPLFEKETRFNKLKEDSDIKTFLLYDKTNAFDFQKRYTQVSFEEFSGNKLDTSVWSNAYKWSNGQIKGNYSNEGEYQAYTDGENTEVIDGQLHITTKRKSAQGLVWSSEKGFITKPFDYTSDLISGINPTSESGCVLVKFKTESTNKAVQHFIRAYDAKNQRCITLLESKTKRKFMVGRSVRGKEELYSKITGLNTQKDFHILEMEWNSEIVSWRINGQLIHQDSRISEMKEMHLTIGSRITNKKGGEGKIIVDYIRVFDERK